MPYTAPILSDATAALADRLNDSSKVRWIDAELSSYVRESIRVWNAYTSHFRARASTQTVMGSVWYDIPTVLPTLRAYTLTVYDLITDIEYALLEPPTPSAWSGTSQFTLAQITQAIERRRNLFLLQTGVVQSLQQVVVTNPAADGRETLPETTIAVRRAVWTPATTLIPTVLQREDRWGADHYSPYWPIVPGYSEQYSISTTPPLEFQLIPPSNINGTLDLVQITRGDAIVVGTDALLNIPDDWVWVLKWGVLADLLGGDGLTRDPARATYCESRWANGVQAAKQAPVVMAAMIDTYPARTAGLSDVDAYSPYWSLVPGIPQGIVLAGQTLFATNPPAGAKPIVGGDWTLTLDVVRNAPVPLVASDPLQIGPELYDVILDYAQHLASFKDGPPAVQMSTPLLQRFLSAAGISMQIQSAQQPSRSQLVNQTQQDTGTTAYDLPIADSTETVLR